VFVVGCDAQDHDGMSLLRAIDGLGRPLPGVADLTKLMTIAARIGVADSARHLKKNRNLIGHVIKGRFGSTGCCGS
jgi:hypothetical protein